VDSNLILHSKYYIDCTGRITEDAFLTISGNSVLTVAQGKESTAVHEFLDLGNCILIPGLINAHTHLELTLAHNKVSRHPLFTDWIRDVVRVTHEWDEEYYGRSLREGMQQSLAAGTTTIGDIVRQADENIYLDFPARARLFYEIIDFNPLTADKTLASLEDRLENFSGGTRLGVGISPHTPFTVSERLLEDCIQLARSRNIPLCIHLSETEAEVEFIKRGTGEILGFRQEFGLPPQWKPPQKSPVKYVQELGLLDEPAALVHCNYLDDEDLDILTASDASVIFCPGSHRFFGHRPHRVQEMLEKGINVALGTDSLASNDSLSLLTEMKIIRNSYPDIAPVDILRMATVNGLEALGFTNEFDAAQSGRLADLTGVTLAAEALERAESPLDALFAESAETVFSMSNGQVLLNPSNRERVSID
jgi:cytosine/adenosine deaminase-related metal-dependent hydrolase